MLRYLIGIFALLQLLFVNTAMVNRRLRKNVALAETVREVVLLVRERLGRTGADNPARRAGQLQRNCALQLQDRAERDIRDRNQRVLHERRLLLFHENVDARNRPPIKHPNPKLTRCFAEKRGPLRVLQVAKAAFVRFRHRIGPTCVFRGRRDGRKGFCGHRSLRHRVPLVRVRKPGKQPPEPLGERELRPVLGEHPVLLPQHDVDRFLAPVSRAFYIPVAMLDCFCWNLFVPLCFQKIYII